MTNLIKKNSFYEVKNTSKTTMSVEGSVTITEEKVIQSLYLTFKDADKNVGSVNYSEHVGSSSYSYNIQDESKKAEIMSLTEEVISDIKGQLPA